MKNYLLAAAIALGSIAAPVADASAATVKVIEKKVVVRDRHPRETCRVRTVKTYRNHKLIVKKVRVCR